MCRGIAHDLKNILNPLLLYTDVIRDAAGNPDEVLDVVDRIERILNRGLQTVERLRDFSRQSPEETEAVAYRSECDGAGIDRHQQTEALRSRIDIAIGAVRQRC